MIELSYVRSYEAAIVSFPEIVFTSFQPAATTGPTAEQERIAPPPPPQYSLLRDPQTKAYTEELTFENKRKQNYTDKLKGSLCFDKITLNVVQKIHSFLQLQNQFYFAITQTKIHD